MKKVRNITVGSKEYCWSLKNNEIFTSGRNILVVLKGTSYSRLYIDPYSHDFEICPKSVANGIHAARKLGWQPESNSGDMHIKSNNGVDFEPSNI